MIKVLNIISDSNIGGAGRCVLYFLKHFDRSKFALKVIIPRGSLLKDEIERLGIKTIEVDSIAEKSLDIKAVRSLYKIIKLQKPDIVHTHGSMSGRIAARFAGVKVIYTRHSVFPVSPKISKGIGKIINKTINEYFADDIIAVAQAAKENLTDGGIDEKKIRVILNGVEAVEKKTDEQCDEIRKKYKIDKEDFVLSIMARLDEVKGHKYIIEAAEMLKDKGFKIKIIIAGAGPTEESLIHLVNEKNLNDTIIFAGFISDVSEVLSITDIQLNASFGTEATSLALLEGMSMGIAGIVSNYGGNPGVIKDGENGLLFKLKDSLDLAKKIEFLIADKEQLKKLGEGAIEIFNKKFTANVYTKQIEEVYENLC